MCSYDYIYAVGILLWLFINIANMEVHMCAQLIISGLETLGVLDLCRQHGGVVGEFLLQDQPTSRIDSAAALERVIEIKMSPEGSSSRAVEEEVALNWHYFLMAVEGMFIQWLIQLNLAFRSIVQYSHFTIDVRLMVYVVQSIGIQSQ